MEARVLQELAQAFEERLLARRVVRVGGQHFLELVEDQHLVGRLEAAVGVRGEEVAERHSMEGFGCDCALFHSIGGQHR